MKWMKSIASGILVYDSSKSVHALANRPTASYGYQRIAPHDRKLDGTVNWERLSQNSARFSPRHSHATTIFKCADDPSEMCIWLTGGYSESHRTWDLEFENENNDVWFSRDGATWNQVIDLDGDFLRGVGNWDAKPGSYVAPWYSRYGHSLDTLDGDGDGIADVMVLAGGNSPIPSNDVWITRSGKKWLFDGYAPWSKRAYHASVVFQNKLYILGGTPLSNDVWMGSLVKNQTHDAGYSLEWTQISSSASNKVPWAPSKRAGLCAVSQLRNINTTSGVSKIEKLFVIGGMAEGDDGIRTRNDVWESVDGLNWDQVHPPNDGASMPWRGRAFHTCTTWNSLNDRSRYVSDDSLMHQNKDDTFANHTTPRIFITGGGYMGTKGNNEVRSLEAFTDTWFSSDGSSWNRVNYEEGSMAQRNIYSTNEWSESTVDGKKKYLGKWGHSVEAFYSTQDIDLDGIIATTNVSLNVCTNSEVHSPVCARTSVVEARIPTLFVIGGKLESGPMVNDVFASRQGIHCELNGKTCEENGNCGPATIGCICHSGNYTDEHCVTQIHYSSHKKSSASYLQNVAITTILVTFSINLFV